MRWLLLMMFILAAAAQTPKPPRPAPQQPVAYSHKVHAGTLKLKCNMCHPNRDPGETMGITAASVCMQCHSAVKTESPEVQKLTEFAKANREIKWARVYQIPSYVFFSHRAHLEAGNTCAECHGSIAERDQLYREG